MNTVTKMKTIKRNSDDEASARFEHCYEMENGKNKQ